MSACQPKNKKRSETRYDVSRSFVDPSIRISFADVLGESQQIQHALPTPISVPMWVLRNTLRPHACRQKLPSLDTNLSACAAVCVS